MRILPIVSVLAIIAFIFVACSEKIAAPLPAEVSPKQSSAQKPGLKIGIRQGNIAPDFQLSGFQIKKNAETGEMEYEDIGNMNLYGLRGQVVMINFWATWCPYCVNEMASMERMYREYKDRGFTIMAVDTGGRGETFEGIVDYVKRNNLTFPTLIDSSGKVSPLFMVTSIPATYIVDREGIIRKVVTGSRNWDEDENRKPIADLL